MKNLKKRILISMVTWFAPLALCLCFPAQHVLADDFVWELLAPSTNWDGVSNWAGTLNEFPDDNTDSATVTVDSGSGVAPVLVANRVIGALTLSSNGDVDTGGFALTVQESLFQNGTTIIEDSNSTLTVRPSLVFNDFDTDNLFINSGGDLRLRDGARVQVDAILENNVGGLIFGEGTLEINGSETFDNNGQIQALTGILQVQSSGPALIDLDGGLENGILISRDNAMLVIDSPLTGPFFDGQVRILGGEVQINDFWALTNTGGTVLEFDAGFDGGTTATLSGTGFNLSGEANIISETAILAVPTTVSSTASLNISDDTTLQFDAPATVDDPETIDNGFSTTLVVNDIVNIGTGAGNFNWDGLGQNGVVDGTTIVNPGGDLNIDVGSIDEPGLAERYSGQITINSGSMDVQNVSGQWEHQGSFDMNNTNGTIPVLSGEEVLMTGFVDVGGTGFSRIAASAIMGSSSHADVSSNATLCFMGPNLVINGGDWTGSGEIELDADLTTVSSSTTVNMPNGIFDIDGLLLDDTVSLNAPLILNVESIDSNGATDDICNTLQINNAGTLDINFSDSNHSYVVDGTLDLNALGGGFASTHLDGADVELRGDTDVSGNSISRARVDLTGFMSFAAGATFSLNGGTTANPSRIFNSTTFAGNGELIIGFDRAAQAEDATLIAADVQNNGYFEPGFSIGVVEVLGNYRQANSGTLTVELTDGPNTVQHDLLAAVGLANLDGDLRVKLIDEGNGVPVLQVGDQFRILTSTGGVVNQFDNVSVSIGDGEGYEWEVIYDTNEVIIRVDSVIPNLILGDVNGDGSTDLLDVAPFVDAINSGTYIIQADVNCDGSVDLLDVGPFVELLGG